MPASQLLSLTTASQIIGETSLCEQIHQFTWGLAAGTPIRSEPARRYKQLISTTLQSHSNTPPRICLLSVGSNSHCKKVFRFVLQRGLCLSSCQLPSVPTVTSFYSRTVVFDHITLGVPNKLTHQLCSSMIIRIISEYLSRRGRLRWTLI